jgi:glutamate synthase domain-containing protein 1
MMMTANGLSIVGWRDVPVDESVLGVLSKDFVPTIRQVCRVLSYAAKMTYLGIYLSTKSA